MPTPTPVSLGIILASVAVLLLRNISPELALWPLDSGLFYPWQVVSYAFLHGSFGHLFFNMFAVYMFGTPLERAWGPQRFSVFYAACIIGAALMQIIVQQFEGGVYPTIGASGGVFGLLLAYGVMWPRNKIFLIFLPIPIEARWFVLIYGALELLFGVTRTMPGIAHFAHLGGMVFGAILLYRWGWRPGMTWKR
jgi:membrane associated rhomboid family serine protease